MVFGAKSAKSPAAKPVAKGGKPAAARKPAAKKAVVKKAAPTAAKKPAAKAPVAKKAAYKPVAKKSNFQKPSSRPAVNQWDRKPVKKGQTVNLKVPAPKNFACTPPPQHARTALSPAAAHTHGSKPCRSTHTHPLALTALALTALALTALAHTLSACVRLSDGLPGSYNIIGGSALEFDPYGFLNGKTELEVNRYRECELTHGRVGMLAAVGFIVQERPVPSVVVVAQSIRFPLTMALLTMALLIMALLTLAPLTMLYSQENFHPLFNSVGGPAIDQIPQLPFWCPLAQLARPARPSALAPPTSSLAPRFSPSPLAPPSLSLSHLVPRHLLAPAPSLALVLIFIPPHPSPSSGGGPRPASASPSASSSASRSHSASSTARRSRPRPRSGQVSK